MKKANAEKGPKLSWKGLRNLVQLYTYIKPYRVQFALGLLFLMLSSLSNLAFPKLIGDLVNGAQVEDISAAIGATATLLVIILIAQSVFSYFRVVLFVNVAERSLAALRQDVYKHLIQLPMSFFSQKRVGELNSRISADVTVLQDTFTTTLAEFLRQMIIIIGGIALLSITSGKLTLFMLAILPPIMIVAVIFGKFIRKYSKTVQDEVAQSNTIVEETLQGIQSVKAYANEWFEVDRYKTKTDKVADIAVKGGKYRAAFSAFVILGIFGAIIAVFWRGALLIGEGQLQSGDLISFMLYSVFIGGSIGGLADIYARLQKAVGATEELLKIIEEPKEPELSVTSAVYPDPVKGKIRFDNLQFAYPSRPDQQVLNNLSLTINRGEQVAIIGPSGSGKTTITNLLLRFYEPTSGVLFFDEKPASAYNLTALRSQMALVPQDILLFGGTIRENIAYGKPGASDAEIRAAAEQANAHEFIAAFTEGYDTLVGERGIQLSGGQRQRIAIARAVLKDPAILILDEATSALDSASEKLVQDALDKLMQNRTSIVIAHRLSTIKNADQIVVLKDGNIVEIGNHADLMEREEGLYKSYRNMQVVG
ncbi:MAG: ATP-binding cassette domain-containing protein [Schleiferiaceae bacterium]|nr:ATP-binding cassette domain-containing protein [Schleiferiaceae bacterium]